MKINGSRNRPILLDVHYSATGRPKPLVVFCHGFKGFKDWGHFNLVAAALAGAGFVCTKFNFSFNGGTESQPVDFPDLEAFGQNNLSTELDDLGCVLDAWGQSGAFAPDAEVDRQAVYLIGHSRGGGVCTIRASEDRRVRKLVTWAGVGWFGRFFNDPSLLESWKRDGVIHIPNSRTNQMMPMYYQYYEDFLANQDRLDIAAAAARLEIPWLIVHGTADTTVPVSDAETLHAARPGSELFRIDGGDHTFGGRHPWTDANLPEQSRQMLERTIAFLKS